jgi:hypothetical protein
VTLAEQPEMARAVAPWQQRNPVQKNGLQQNTVFAGIGNYD